MDLHEVVEGPVTAEGRRALPAPDADSPLSGRGAQIRARRGGTLGAGVMSG